MTESYVRFYRPRHRFQDRFRAYKLEIDGEVAGAVRYGAEITVAVSPGRHTLRALIDWTGSEPVTVQVEAGGTVTVRVEPSDGAAMATVGTTDQYLRLTAENA
ncbi:hypothetical protein AB0C07_09885 [Actinoplanes missouriensis]|uniref:hypothetical protein n=1 Tax=Actinoplanes missouriensis TaxID=1866 RepID=UPI0033C559A4